MNIVKLLLLFFIISLPSHSQTLFEESIPKTNSTPLTVKQIDPKKSVSIKSSPSFNLVSTNLESVIARADIQFMVEVPKSNDFSVVLFTHYNPQSSFNNETGDIGFLGGGRLYLDSIQQKNPFYMQGLIGVNHYSSWDLFVSVEFGQRYQWRESIFFDISAVVNRSYSNDALDPMVYLKANVSFKLNQSFIPFL